MLTPCEFYVDPLGHGRVTPRALLAPTGTLSFPFPKEFLQRKLHMPLARLAGGGWFFNVGFTAGKLMIQRNGGQIAVDENWCNGRDLPDQFLASWTWNEIILSFGNHSNHWGYQQIVKRSPLLGPPPELVRWVRRQELAPVEFFPNEEQFCLRVHSSLQRFDERFKGVLTGNIFWDVERNGNTVVSRKPKREVDVQGALHAMLVDQMQLSDIDILPESRTSSGAVDFLVIGAIEGNSTAKLCLEFKNAHSPDLIKGLSKLRSYMDKLEVANGAYCILDYRDGVFKQPRISTADLIAKLHEVDHEKSRWPNRPIKIHWINIGEVGSVPL